MKFSKGEIAIHVGGGEIAANAEVEILAVGPWEAGDCRGIQGITNLDPADYCCKDLSDGQPFFTYETKLRKRRPPEQPADDQEFINWCTTLGRDAEEVARRIHPSIEEINAGGANGR